MQACYRQTHTEYRTKEEKGLAQHSIKIHNIETAEEVKNRAILSIEQNKTIRLLEFNIGKA